jgi:hypothetical protein
MESYKNASPRAIHSEHPYCLDEAIRNQRQAVTDHLLMLKMATLRLCFWSNVGVLRLCNANDQHHLVVSSDQFPVECLGLGIDRATPVIILLRGFPNILFSLSFNDVVVGRTALVEVRGLSGCTHMTTSTHQSKGR